MVFENASVKLIDLPHAERVEVNRLASNYLKVAYISSSLFYLLLLAIGVGIAWYHDLWNHFMVLIGASIALLILYIFTMLLVRAEYRIQGYAIRDKDILYRSGVIFRSETVVPFNRVQHCEIKQGPIQRMFGLKSLDVFTAGGAKSDLSIPGLEEGKAQQLKEFIIKTVGEDETVES